MPVSCVGGRTSCRAPAVAVSTASRDLSTDRRYSRYQPGPVTSPSDAEAPSSRLDIDVGLAPAVPQPVGPYRRRRATSQPAVERVRIGRRNLFANFQQLQVGQSDFLLPGPPPRRFRRAIEQRAAVCLHQFVGCPCGSVVRGSFGKGIAGRCQPTRNFVLRFFGGSALHARTFLGSCHELWRSGD